MTESGAGYGLTAVRLQCAHRCRSRSITARVVDVEPASEQRRLRGSAPFPPSDLGGFRQRQGISVWLCGEPDCGRRREISWNHMLRVIRRDDI
jgi:hypothetical protein